MIYILGTERSASTWVANILDHHPQMDVYMEPLSSFNSRFKNWPNRFERIDDIEQKADEFKIEFDIQRKHNRFFLTRFSDSSKAWQTDLRLAHFLVRKKLAPDPVRDFVELNFHRKNRQLAVKKKKPLQTVIKEVRLNFNVALISALDASPKVIVTIREMASCVNSMMKFIGQGQLVDLKKDLEMEYGKADFKILCRYWFESYSALLETLRNQKIPYEIVSHTELLKNSIVGSEKIFRFLDVLYAPQVKKYLESSDKAIEGIHSTSRNRKELLQQIQDDRKHIYSLIGIEQLQKIQDHPILNKFV